MEVQNVFRFENLPLEAFCNEYLMNDCHVPIYIFDRYHQTEQLTNGLFEKLKERKISHISSHSLFFGGVDTRIDYYIELKMKWE